MTYIYEFLKLQVPILYEQTWSDDPKKNWNDLYDITNDNVYSAKYAPFIKPISKIYAPFNEHQLVDIRRNASNLRN